jgi:hypothetical protein
MVTITITVAALVATSVLGYLTYHYKNEAENSKVKYNSIKEFADRAGSQILKYEATSKELTNTIILLRSKLEAVAAKQAPLITANKVVDKKDVSETKLAEFTTTAIKAKPRRRYKNKSKAKDTNQN